MHHRKLLTALPFVFSISGCMSGAARGVAARDAEATRASDVAPRALDAERAIAAPQPAAPTALATAAPEIAPPIAMESPVAESRAAKNEAAAPPTYARPTSAPPPAALVDALEGKSGGAVAPRATSRVAAATVGSPAMAPAIEPPPGARRTSRTFVDEPSERGPAAAPVAAAPVAPPSEAVRAGEWDDNANYREFSRWLATESAPFHRIDVRDRTFLVVRDADGRAVPDCRVTIADAAQHTVTLTTGASGRAILFPHAEGLDANALVATAACGAGATARFAARADDAIVDLRLPGARPKVAARSIDVAFILDTTGSMAEEIAAVKATIQKVTTRLGAGGDVHVRIGLVEYKDRGDELVTRVFPMSTDLGAFAERVSGLRASGGGDMPESVNDGLHVALTQLAWDDAATARVAFLVGDAPPHLDYANDVDYAVSVRDAAHRGVHVYTVAASGMDEVGQVVFRQIAAYTGGTEMFVLRGGAGPQSTGAGDPKSSCGGTQTAYASGNLDALVVRKIDAELASYDADPLRIAGLGQDENAKPCDQRLVMAR